MNYEVKLYGHVHWIFKLIIMLENLNWIVRLKTMNYLVDYLVYNMLYNAVIGYNIIV